MYNTVEISADRAIPCIEACWKLNTPLLLLGKPGIGKSSIVREFAKDKGLRLIDIRLSLKERGDFVAPVVNHEKEALVSYLTELIPFDDVPTLLFFDEITNAPGEIQKMVYSIVLEHELDGRKLPESMYVMGAGNTVEDGCDVYELGHALNDRFTILRITHDITSFLNYAIKHNFAKEVITFLKNKPEYLYGKNGVIPDGQYIFATPRSWEEVSNFYKAKLNKEVLSILVPGRIGKETTAEFFYVVEELTCLPPIEDFLNAKTDNEIMKLLKPVNTLSAVYGLGYSLLSYCKTDVEAYIKSTQVLNCLASVKDGLPRNEVRVTIMELLMKKANEELDEEAFYFTYMESQAYKNYDKSHKDLMAMAS